MKAKSKKTLTIALSVILVAAIAVGATLAYLFFKTDPVNNVFTFAENIRGELSEPSWNPDDALDLVPGAEIPKDPQITNTSENGVVEYAAIKLTFFNGAGEVLSAADMAKLMGLIEIDWSNNWTRIDGTATSPQQIHMFNDTLPQGVTTDPLFYSVTIPDTVSVADLEWLRGSYGHTDACYQAGAHDSSMCTITWRHHEKCAIFGESGAENTANGGTVNGKTCDCSAAEIHNSRCPLLIKTLTGTCGHDTVISGLGNFTIKAEGGVVQADAFANAADAAPKLIELFQ